MDGFLQTSLIHVSFYNAVHTTCSGQFFSSIFSGRLHPPPPPPGQPQWCYVGSPSLSYSNSSMNPSAIRILTKHEQHFVSMLDVPLSKAYYPQTVRCSYATTSGDSMGEGTIGLSHKNSPKVGQIIYINYYLSLVEEYGLFKHEKVKNIWVPFTGQLNSYYATRQLI